MELEKICKQVCEIAKEAGTFLKTEISKVRATDIETKGLHDFCNLCG